jgi:hypothetical protein
VLARYALSYGTGTQTVLSKIAAELGQLRGTDLGLRQAARRELVALGAPAYQVLQALRTDDAQLAREVERVLGRLRPLHAAIEAEHFDPDVRYLSGLASTTPRARERLLQILPEAAPARGVDLWWEAHGRGYRWDTVRDRYVSKRRR